MLVTWVREGARIWCFWKTLFRYRRIILPMGGYETMVIMKDLMGLGNNKYRRHGQGLLHSLEVDLSQLEVLRILPQNHLVVEIITQTLILLWGLPFQASRGFPHFRRRFLCYFVHLFFLDAL